VAPRDALVVLRTLLSGLVVIVVDDDAACCEALGLVLADLGASVRTARSGSDALLLVRQRRPDLVLTDLAMPHMSGADLLRFLRRDHPSATLPVVAVTAFMDLRVGKSFDGYLSKPFDYDDLRVTLQEVFCQRPALIRQQWRRLRGEAAQRRNAARVLRDLSAVALHRAAQLRAS
jgi:CheY-like chemotaxis protein